MTFLPIVSREMNIASRRKGTYWWRVGAALVGLLTLGWLFLVSAAGMPLANQGKLLFTVLSGLTFVFALMIGVVFTSDSLSEEKREGTLGLLFLTDLKGHDVAIGKLAASSLIAAFAILGIVPMISLTLLLGGVTLDQVGLVALLVLNTILLSLGAGLFISALSQNERRAMFATLFLIFILAIGPYGISAYYHGLDNPMFLDNTFLYSSPIYSFWLTLESARLPTWKHTFAITIGIQHALAWVLLILASNILPRVAHDVPAGKRLAKWHEWVARWNYGAGEKRTRYRSRLLDRNAFSWLAGREKVKSKYVWVILLFFVLLWYWIYRQFPRMAFDLPIVGTLLFLVHFILKIWAASEVARRMIEDRRSGALELLLSTPLSVKQVAGGQTHALWRLFGWPVILLLIAELILARYGVKTWYSESHNREILMTFGLGIGFLLVDLWALKWVAMWRSMFGRSIGKVLVTTLLRVLLVPWLLFPLLVLLVMLLQWLFNNRVGDLNMYILWGTTSLFCALFFALPARANFLRHFREIAAQRFDAKAQKPPGWSLLFSDLRRKIFRPKAVEAKPPSFLRRHWFLTSATSVLLAVLVSCYIRQTYWSYQANARLRELESRGIPTSAAQFARAYLKPTIESDAGIFLVTPANLTGGSIIDSSASLPLTTNQVAYCVKLHAANSAHQDKLKNLPRYTTAWFDFANPAPWMGSSLWTSQSWFQLLQSEITLSVHERRVDDALTYTRSFIHLLKLFNNQPATEAIGIQNEGIRRLSLSLDRLLHHGRLTPAQIEALHKLVGELHPPDDRIVKSFRGDLVRGITFLRSDVSSLQSALGMGPRGGPEQALFALAYGFAARTGRRDKMLYEFLEVPAQIEAMARLPLPERVKRAQTMQPRPVRASFGFGVMNHFLAAPNGMVQIDTITRAQLTVLRTSLAIEHYLAKHGRLPNELSELELLNDRKDPYTGNELSYRTSNHGYVVYSFAQNMEDDGGRGQFHGYGKSDIAIERSGQR